MTPREVRECRPAKVSGEDREVWAGRDIPVDNPLWFTPTIRAMRAQTGNPAFQYEIACAQLCSLGHARVRGFVTVKSADEFQEWMEAAAAEQAEAADDPFR